MQMDKVTQMVLGAHKTFSKVTGWDSEGRIACRQRIDHRDHPQLGGELSSWPKQTPGIDPTRYRSTSTLVSVSMLWSGVPPGAGGLSR